MVVLKSGTNVGSGSVSVGYSCSQLKVKGNGGAAVITLNGKTIAVTATTTYETFDVTFDTFTVTSGNIDYVAIG